MTMRVFSGSLATETNTFAPMPTGLESFKDRGYFPAGRHPKELTFFSGPLCALREVAPAARLDPDRRHGRGRAAQRHRHARSLRAVA